MPNTLSKVPLLSTRDQITATLREEIFIGKLSEGVRLREAELASRFGVSRGPIREAISLLTSEGVLVAKPNCGVTVASPAPRAIRELILPIRKTIELFAIREVFDKLDASDFRFWGDVVYNMERACRERRTEAFTQLDLQFHRHVIEKADSADLLAIWQTLVSRLRSHFWATVREHDLRGDLMKLHAHHVELLTSLQCGDRSTAINALERHIDDN